MLRAKRGHLLVLIFFDSYRGLQQLRLRRPLQKQRENQIPASPVIVPESVLVEVGLQILLADRVVHPA